MRAAVYTRYGPPEVVEIKHINKPIPKNDEVLIKVYSTTVTTGDWRLRSLKFPRGFGILGRLIFGIYGPRQTILGTEFAGVVEAVGKDVTKFSAGDRVFAFTGAAMGCHVEYKCLQEKGPIGHIPANLTTQEAAGLSFGGTTALNFLRLAKLQSGNKVLVNGASGGVGTAMVQLSKYYGAEVTAVCSTRNLQLVKSLGADHVIDYTTHNFTKNGELYDVIVDVAGTAPFHISKGSLKDTGRLLLVVAGLPEILSIPWISLTSRKRIIVAGPPQDYTRELARLAAQGHLRPVIGRRFAFEDIVEAHRYVESGHKRGNAVVDLVKP